MNRSGGDRACRAHRVADRRGGGRRQCRRHDDRGNGPGEEPVSSIAEIDFIRMNFDPFGPQSASKIPAKPGGDPLNDNKPHRRVHTERGR